MSRHAWMVGPSGEVIRVLDPVMTPVSIVSIAHSLGNLARWNGHSTRYYSVASHSLHVARLLRRTHGIDGARVGLLHDAHEAYIGDMPTPLKGVLGETWHTLERAWERRIRQAFDLPGPDDEIWSACKHADRVARATEQEQIVAWCVVPNDLAWPDLPPPDLTWRCEEHGTYGFTRYARAAGLL